jgi:hypothetical protein
VAVLRTLALVLGLSFILCTGAWAQDIRNEDPVIHGPEYEDAPVGCISIPKEMRARNTVFGQGPGVCGWCAIKTICDYLKVPGTDGMIEEMDKRREGCPPELADRILNNRGISHVIGVSDTRIIQSLTKKGVPASRIRKTSVADLKRVTAKGIPVGIVIWKKIGLTHMVTLAGWTPAGDMWVIDPNGTSYKQLAPSEWDGGWAVAIVPKGQHVALEQAPASGSNRIAIPNGWQRTVDGWRRQP